MYISFASHHTSMLFCVLFTGKCKFLDRMQKRHEEENVRYKENMRKKMEMLLKLKGDITANRVFIFFYSLIEHFKTILCLIYTSLIHIGFEFQKIDHLHVPPKF